MKLTFKSLDGTLTVEGEPKTVKDCFEFTGMVNEYLIAEACGCCKSKSTFPMAKHTQEYVFYEWKCRDCGASFSFGQAKERGRLFPKRKDKNGAALANRGWSVYQAGGNRDEHDQSSGYREFSQEREPGDDTPY